MKDLLIKTIETLGFPVFLQGTLNEDEEYPDNFFTYKNMETEGQEFYDNDENACVWEFILAFYSNDPSLIDKNLLKAKELLKKQDFIVSGKGYDVASDKITHTGRGILVQIIEK